MKLEIRSDCIVIDGYVNAVERYSRVLNSPTGKFIEKVKAGVFKRALEVADNVDVLIDHDYNRKVACTSDNTADLYEDNIGLRANVIIRDKQAVEDAKSGKFVGWSFGFCRATDEKTTGEDGIVKRAINSLILKEVSLIDDKMIPCYNATSVEMRGETDELLEIRGGNFDKVVEQDVAIDYRYYDEALKNL